MTVRYASGKHALGECDLCGLACSLNELRPIVENQIRTGMRACSDCWTADHPQWQAGKNVVADAEMLRDPRPDRRPADLTNIRWGWNPVFGFEARASLGEITIGGNVTSKPSFVHIPSNVDMLVFDTDTLAEYQAAIDAAPLGSKRLAAANALVAAFSPSHSLYILRDVTTVVAASYSTGLAVLDSGDHINLSLGVLVSATALIDADIDSGTWTFELAGGVGGMRRIRGGVGPIGSNKPIELSSDITAGAEVTLAVMFTLPRGMDLLP